MLNAIFWIFCGLIVAPAVALATIGFGMSF